MSGKTKAVAGGKVSSGKTGLLEKLKAKCVSEYGELSRVVLAFTGGLDTTVCAALLKQCGAEIVTLTLDLGQRRSLKEVEEKAKKLGVKTHYSLDVRDEFVRDFVHPAIKANCLWEGELNSEALARPLIVKHAVEIAKKEGAQAIAYGGSGIGNGQIRVENGIRALAPEVRPIAPIRDFDLRREDEAELADQLGLPKLSEKINLFASDENLWGRSLKAGPLEEPGLEVPEQVFTLTASAENAPDKPEYAQITFDNGVPVTLQILDDKKKQARESKDALEIIELLNVVGGKHGVGRLDHMEDKAVGLKAREVYECPAASILIQAHKDLERLVLTSSELEVKQWTDYEWNKLVDEGKWFTSLRKALDAFTEELQQSVDGTVLMKLHKGTATPVARSSKHALYDKFLSSYGREGVWNYKDAKAFTRVHALQEIIAYLVRKE